MATEAWMFEGLQWSCGVVLRYLPGLLAAQMAAAMTLEWGTPGLPPLGAGTGLPAAQQSPGCVGRSLPARAVPSPSQLPCVHLSPT